MVCRLDHQTTTTSFCFFWCSTLFFSYDLFLLFFRGPAHTLTLRERERAPSQAQHGLKHGESGLFWRVRSSLSLLKPGMRKAAPVSGLGAPFSSSTASYSFSSSSSPSLPFLLLLLFFFFCCFFFSSLGARSSSFLSGALLLLFPPL